jgi:hypothetical protein
MAKIKLDLTQFKASGVYTLEFDASESIILNTQTVRLIVGFSRKGPFNSPVYLPDVKTARRIFGEIDPFLESRGSFFHRSLFTCLEIGPIFGLNLLPLNNQPISQGGDAVEYKSFSLDTAESNGVVTKGLYSNFYNTQRFWYPDESNMIAIANANALNTGKLLHIVNLSQGPISIIIKKTTVNGFDITARDWYGQSGETKPEYIEDFDYIADYFVEVILVQGIWTNYKKLSTDPVFSKYFNDRGIIKSQLNAFLSAEEVTTVSRFSGCLIPDFVDGNGVTHSLDVIVNNSVATTGVFLSINKEALADYETSTSKYDVVGHHLADPTHPEYPVPYLNMLSYRTNVKEEFQYTEKTGSFDTTVYDAETAGDFYTESYKGKGILGAFKNVLVLKRPLSSSVAKYAEYQYIVSNLTVGGSLIEMDSGNFAKVESKQETLDTNGGTVLKITLSHPEKAKELTMTPVTVLGASFTTTQSVTLTNGATTFVPTSLSQLRVNQPITGTGIPADTYIEELISSSTKSVVLTSGDDTFTPASATNLRENQKIVGTGIPTGTYITDITGGVVTMSANATSSVTSTLAFSEVVVVSELLSASGTVTVTFLASVTISGDATSIIDDGDEVLIKNKIDTTTFYLDVSATPILNGSTNTIIPVTNSVSLQDMSLNPSYYTVTYGAEEFPDLSTDQITIAYTPDLITFNTATTVNRFICYQYSQVYKDYDLGFLVDGDKYYYTTSLFYYLKYIKTTDADGVPVLEIRAYEDSTLSTVITESTEYIEVNAGLTGHADAAYVVGTTYWALSAPGDGADLDAGSYVAELKYMGASTTTPANEIFKVIGYYTADGTGGDITAAPTVVIANVFDIDLDTTKITTNASGEPSLALNLQGAVTGSTYTQIGPFIDILNYEKAGVLNTGGDFYIYPLADSFSEDVPVQTWNGAKSEVDINVEDSTGLEVGQYLVSYTTDEEGADVYRLTKIIRKRKIFDELTSLFRYRYTVNQPLLINNEFAAGTKSVTRYKNIDDFATTYDFTGLSGFKLTSYHLPGDKTNKQSQMEKIYEVLENTNLFEALTSRDVIQFRYIVDTFDGGLQPNNYPKNILAKLAKERLKCLALLNPPSAKQFEASTDPRFTDEPDPVGGNPRPLLNTSYIATGGNQTLGPSFSYSLPDELNGAKHAAFFFPYLVLRDGTKNLTIPPAAHVSNNFVLKFINGFPYSIVAGPRRGILSDSRLVGPELDLSDRDREAIEPFGLNPIVKRARLGTMIYGNQTAYQKVPSALNNVHVRDLLITIEEGVEDILARYIFEFNDATTRLEIKSIVDTFLDGVRSAGGIYNFFSQMDETNNPPELIDQNKAIIDIAVEPARGIQVAISRITVTKTGGANASAFQFV